MLACMKLCVSVCLHVCMNAHVKEMLYTKGTILMNYETMKSWEARLNQCVLIKCHAASHFESTA